MEAKKYTSINVLNEQHTELKRIAEVRGMRITDLGIEMADGYIRQFRDTYGNLLDEISQLENRMNELRSKIPDGQ